MSNYSGGESLQYHPSYGSYYKVNVTREQFDKLKALRAEVFDRWNWETGSDEDRQEFERLDNQIKYIEENYHVVNMVATPSDYAGTVKIYGSTDPNGEF